VKKTVKKAVKGVFKKAGAPAAAAAKPTSGRTIDSSLVKQLAAILDETALTEIEYETGGIRVRVARNHGGGFASPAAMPAAAAPAALPAPAAPADPATNPGTVKSPMVGVCYLLPEPGAAPFAKVGDSVAEGQTLCLIEAMKTFNPVKAPRAGKITQIIVENGAPVEYGEPLLIIE
jgi:acetyl-CoA carboxylase biotin carboxyl carrier protein